MAKSFRGSNSSLVNVFQTLTQNSSAANGTLATILLNEQHKQLLLKFFDNERSFTQLTIGPQTLAFTPSSGTTAVLSGGTQATLSAVWPATNISCQQLVVFTDGEQRNCFFTQGSANVSWQSPLSASVGTTASLVGVQAYPLPANVSKVKNVTINVGQLVYTPAPVQSVQEWTKLNALPYTSSIPAYFYVYNGQVNFWPIPSATGNIITLNCQIQVPDMTYSDYSTGTLNGMTVGSNIVTGSGTSWNTAFPTGVDLTFANLFLSASPSQGDGLLYQIQSFTNGTTAVLTKPVVYAPNVSTASYTIGQYPLLSQDFHDAILYGALRIYFMSTVKDPDKYALYNQLFNEKLELMKYYLATKQVNCDLSATPVLTNPNLYTFAPPNS